MNIALIKQIKIYILLAVLGIMLLNCEESLNGIEDPIESPTTEILNIPVPNTQDNLYSPMLKVGWKGISQGSIIKGYWVSWKSHYLFLDKTIIQEKYFTNEVAQVIAFPSADSINKQILYVKAEDQNGNIDPIGDSVTFYTSRTLPPETVIEFPKNNSSAFIIDNTTITWKGVKIFVSGTSEFGELKDFALQIDNNDWSEWQSDSLFFLNKNNVEGLTQGEHVIKVKSRNTALVEDKTAAEIEINLVNASHEKEWLIIDDTKDQSGGIERPNDEQVDLFYNELLAGIEHDNWDLTNDGVLTRELLGKYKYVLWHCDDNHQTSIPQMAGIITDYLDTKGNFLLSGWNYMTYFDPEGDWADSVKYYGNILQDYFHINGFRTIDDALLDSVYIRNSDNTASFAEIDTNKIWNFRNGLFKVTDYNNPGAFTESMFYYHAADTTDNNYMYSTIGMGYHNSEYRIVVAGFPFYYLTKETAKLVFVRSKEYLETDFPF
ncbi:MAG: hypothetical protein ABFS12_05865 [Bacteroidota bacterium]